MVGNFHFPLGKVLFDAMVDDSESKNCDITSNKMANNAWEVNERCSVFHLPVRSSNGTTYIYYRKRLFCDSFKVHSLSTYCNCSGDLFLFEYDVLSG